MKGNDWWVIEPHADDAFLSMGGHIERKTKEGGTVNIVTVFSDTRKRALDSIAYADAIGATWWGLGAAEPDDGGRHAAATRVIKAMLPGLLKRAPRESHVYMPLGIKHPEHIEVRDAVESLGDFPQRVDAVHNPFYFYLDQPYAATQANGEEVNDKLRDMQIFSYLRPHARKYRHVPLFKDQAKFFYYNPPERLEHNIELLLEYA